MDPQCIEASTANAVLNHVSDQCSFHRCTPDGMGTKQASHSQHDICMANIFQGDLLALRKTLTSLVRPGGRIVMSGILENAQVGQITL